MFGVLPYLDAHLRDYLRDLRLLAGQDSGSDDKAGVDGVVDWFEARFRAMTRRIAR